VVEPGLAEDLRHLGDVAEHVREVTDLHGAPEGGGPFHSQLQVAHDRLARHAELVHEHVPRPNRDAAAGGQAPQG
jgi:hypothetical protein